VRSNTPEQKDPIVVVSSIGENGSVEEAQGLLSSLSGPTRTRYDRFPT
jgi:hypothetical protein